VSCVFTPLRSSKAQKRAQLQKLEVQAVTGFSLNNLPEILALQQSVKPTAIFLFGGKETFLARFLRGKKIRFFGEDAFQQRRSRLSFAMAFSHIDLFLAPNSIVHQALKRLTSKPSLRVPLGLASSSLDRVPSEEIKEKEARLLLVARFDPIKGHREFFAIFRHLLNLWGAKNPRLILDVVGYEANFTCADLEQFAAAAAIPAEAINISVAWQPDLRRLQSKACIGIVSSLGSEQICRVACEFLLEGTPIFVSGVGATEEVLLSAQDGMSYRSLSHEEAAQRLYDLLELSLSEGTLAAAKRRERANKRVSTLAMAEQLRLILGS
jgi:glycosyltransferase involved in cell wall biosynthesis